MAEGMTDDRKPLLEASIIIVQNPTCQFFECRDRREPMRALCLDAFNEAIHCWCAEYGVSATEKLDVRFEGKFMSMRGGSLHEHSLGVHMSSRLRN